MLVTACLKDTKNGNSLSRWGAGKELGEDGQRRGWKGRGFTCPLRQGSNWVLSKALRGRKKCLRVKHEAWHLLATSLYSTLEHQGLCVPHIRSLGATTPCRQDWGTPQLCGQSQLPLKSHMPLAASTHGEAASELTETAEQPNAACGLAGLSQHCPQEGQTVRSPAPIPERAG